MHLFANGAWTTGFLDPNVPKGHVRIDVAGQVALRPVDDQFFVRDRDARMLLQYLRRLGVRRVLRKVRSRDAERHRNDSWLTVGCGTLPDGRPAVFVDPTGPASVERVVLPKDLVRDLDEAVPTHSRFLPAPGCDLLGSFDDDTAAELGSLVGWNPESGVPAHVSDNAFDAILALLGGPPPRGALAVADAPAPSPVREFSSPPPETTGGPHELTCFGYGQYAKTQVMANLSRRLSLTCVHEIDPRQIGPVPEDSPIRWDTSPRPRQDEQVTNGVVAGYHHTHAPLAVELIERGARHVIVEKPIATTPEQLDDLLSAIDRHPSARVHISFQRRHAKVNARLRDDLGPGPLSMAATVYEVPLPAHHWYRWRSVGNEVVSNGCHWIDHFLFLNGYQEPTALFAHRMSTQVLLGIELPSGASGSISLRHGGAPRLGVRDHVTFWNGDRSAVLIDQATYRSEAGFSVGPTRHMHPYAPLEDMYATFADRIAEDLPGDSRESIEVSARVTLKLAEMLEAAS